MPNTRLIALRVSLRLSALPASRSEPSGGICVRSFGSTSVSMMPRTFSSDSEAGGSMVSVTVRR